MLVTVSHTNFTVITFVETVHTLELVTVQPPALAANLPLQVAGTLLLEHAAALSLELAAALSLELASALPLELTAVQSLEQQLPDFFNPQHTEQCEENRPMFKFLFLLLREESLI